MEILRVSKENRDHALLQLRNALILELGDIAIPEDPEALRLWMAENTELLKNISLIKIEDNPRCYPPELIYLENLESLDLSDNSEISTLPLRVIVHLLKIKEVNLVRCRKLRYLEGKELVDYDLQKVNSSIKRKKIPESLKSISVSRDYIYINWGYPKGLIVQYSGRHGPLRFGGHFHRHW